MIRFHYHRSQKDIPKLEIFKGDGLCHVYKDTSRRELETWGRSHGLRAEWIHERTLSYFDALGDQLAWCGAGVAGADLKDHIRAWRRMHGVAETAKE